MQGKFALKWIKYTKTTGSIRTYISIYLGAVNNEKIDEITEIKDSPTRK
jgi:hypothetical protein